jgi:Holliday junction DNA helicase RuvA
MVDLKVDTKITTGVTAVNSETFDEALSALVMLGFQKGASEKVLKKLFKENPDMRVEEAIRLALKQL